MRKQLYSILILLLATTSTLVMCSNSNRENNTISLSDSNIINKEQAEQKSAFARLKAKADSAKLFCSKKGFSTEYCILIDFSIHSGKNRFFVWDFANDTIKDQGLCCHGYGLESTKTKPVFSNTEGSYCSSLGRYRVGARAYSKWGINAHYKLHGLDSTNNNAFRRWVVLHSHNPVSEQEIHPQHLPLGWSQGCPVISNELMRKTDALLKKTDKPLMMWIYN